MSNGTVSAICIAPSAGAPMRDVFEVKAIQGQGLKGDRYAYGKGSFNKGSQGRRQVTLINGLFIPASGFEVFQTRRNIATFGVELMDLIGKEFQVGAAWLRGIKYCDPCLRPSALIGMTVKFRKDDPVVPPTKNY